MGRLLEIDNLHVSIHTYAGEVKAVRGVSFSVDRGEAVAIIGESGCGKSVTVQTLLRLNPSPPTVIKEGQILFDGRDLVRLPNRQWSAIRGREIGMIFQDPMTSLNPTMTIGRQIMEGLVKHQHVGKREAREKAVELLKRVGLSQPDKLMNQYPHVLSGGMRQRVMIAIALATSPKLLIADEPTTALDVTVQAQILRLLKRLQRETGTAILLITHDLGIVADMCDRVLVMYAGKLIESGTVEDIFYRPQHPYTRGLLNSAPRLDWNRQTPLAPISGSPPDLAHPPTGCAFADRCRFAMRICREAEPEWTHASPSQQAACWLLHPLAHETGAVKEEGDRGE